MKVEHEIAADIHPDRDRARVRLRKPTTERSRIIWITA
jgi:hypothetical protein